MFFDASICFFVTCHVCANIIPQYDICTCLIFVSFNLKRIKKLGKYENYNVTSSGILWFFTYEWAYRIRCMWNDLSICRVNENFLIEGNIVNNMFCHYEFESCLMPRKFICNGSFIQVVLLIFLRLCWFTLVLFWIPLLLKYEFDNSNKQDNLIVNFAAVWDCR